ncbi:MAG: HIT family protein [Candidatus Paceibacterota bacterium]
MLGSCYIEGRFREEIKCKNVAFAKFWEKAENRLKKQHISAFLLKPGRCRKDLLIVSNEHVPDAFGLSAEEWVDFPVALTKARAQTGIHSPAGFNIGVNCGTAAGQMHFHAHLIPRYHGDVPDPTGGVRNIFRNFVAPKT